ncbi:Piso0_000700 [Millerozyma farinosa CBS 7064]|uniref:Piso0_000700 protein n=1 Tax=Pichia sorbitophila (strain ATCC MYA-4447 / BCRC 22081 / CBS 7064 / NBRC 10061 / NRRL Y-12695) TaxID=559304 RepID=G8YRA0_PICSO|nr:Piso0_000700 [Millerozyma farinosa CBS 7064]
MTQDIETVYVRNLNDRISLNKLKPALEEKFQAYGRILQLTAHKNLKMKGQAFITFESSESSKRAVEEAKNIVLFGKPMQVTFAKSNSDNFYLQVEQNEGPVQERKRHKAELSEKETASNTKPTKVASKASTKDFQSWKNIPPNKILLLQNLKNDTTSQELNEYFDAYDGFINLRLVKIRNLCFVEFENESASTKCLETGDYERLKSFGDNIILTYAKK